jgi:phosphoglycerate dehydrogenase-like enzyme
LVLSPQGPNEGTKGIEKICAARGLRCVVGRSAEELGDAACAQASALILYAAFRDTARPVFLKTSPGTLRWVHSLFAGVDAMLFPELQQAAHVTMTLTRGVYSSSLAEWAITGILYFEKHLPRLLAQKAARRWEKFTVGEVRGKTMVVVGYGDIGRATAQHAKGMGVARVVGVNRRGSVKLDGVADAIVGNDRLAEVLPTADYVVLVLPLTPATKGLFGAREFAAMKPSAVLVNIGRGATVDDAALVAALREHRIRGAALDVFHPEPLPASSPLWELDNVLISPHCADVVEGWLPEALGIIRENIDRFLAGRPLMFVADKTAGY